MESKEARRLEKLATGTIININNEYQISNAKYPENECLTPPGMVLNFDNKRPGEISKLLTRTQF